MLGLLVSWGLETRSSGASGPKNRGLYICGTGARIKASPKPRPAMRSLMRPLVRCGGLRNYAYHFDACLRYMMLSSYQEYAITMLVIIGPPHHNRTMCTQSRESMPLPWTGPRVCGDLLLCPARALLRTPQ